MTLNNQPGSGAGCVPTSSLQLDGQPRARTIVAVDGDKGIEVVHDQVQIAVVIQVAAGHSMTVRQRIKPPLTTHPDKRHASLVAKGQVRRVEFGIKKNALFALPRGQFF